MGQARRTLMQNHKLSQIAQKQMRDEMAAVAARKFAKGVRTMEKSIAVFVKHAATRAATELSKNTSFSKKRMQQRQEMKMLEKDMARLTKSRERVIFESAEIRAKDSKKMKQLKAAAAL